MDFRHRRPVEWTTFHYTLSTTKFDDGVQYEVRYGQAGTSGAPARSGVPLGLIAKFTSHNNEWYATPDQGDRATLRWYSGFTRRAEAAVFLLGGRFERDIPATLHARNEQRLLRDWPMPVRDDTLPESRRCEVAFRQAIPRQVDEFQILHAVQWRPGAQGQYASATTVSRRGHDGDFCVHNLYWADDNPDRPWYVAEGHYDIPTFQDAHHKAAMIITRYPH